MLKRRRGGKLSNLHLGARDPATDEYVMLGKTFKGLTDAMLEWQRRQSKVPPSTATTWPVVKPAREDASQSTAAETSSGLPI